MEITIKGNSKPEILRLRDLRPGEMFHFKTSLGGNWRSDAFMKITNNELGCMWMSTAERCNFEPDTVVRRLINITAEVER